jgi:hypothetical protein
VGHSKPKYGPEFKAPEDNGDNPPDPDKGNDFSSEVPHLAVPTPWSSPGAPSFNEDPPKIPADGDPPKDIPDIPFLQVNLASLRGGLNTMIADTQTLVNDYESLRLDVFANKDTIFGQNAMVEEDSYGLEYAEASGKWASKIQPQAQEFAASMNPAQEKVLEFAANAIELVGQFIAAVDRAGQTYAAADRAAVFPPPPENPVAKKMEGPSQ